MNNLGIENPISATNLWDAVIALVSIVRTIAIPFLVLAIMWSGFLFVKAQGKPEEINKAKIEIENSLAAADQEALTLITAVINSVGNINPYETAKPFERTLEHEGPVVHGVTLVPGELDTKPKQSNYDSFMKTYKQNNPRIIDDEDDD